MNSMHRIEGSFLKDLTLPGHLYFLLIAIVIIEMMRYGYLYHQYYYKTCCFLDRADTKIAFIRLF